MRDNKMVRVVFAILLVIATFMYCLYRNQKYYKNQKDKLIEECNIEKRINALANSDSKVRIAQMWKDYKLIDSVNGTSFALGYYAAVAIISAGSIIAIAIQEFKEDRSVVGIVFSIGYPIIIAAGVWIFFLIFKKRNSYFCTAVHDLDKALDLEDETYNNRIEDEIKTVFENEMRIKEKLNRHYSAIGILLFVTAVTLFAVF
jgi:hypothetical protein